MERICLKCSLALGGAHVVLIPLCATPPHVNLGVGRVPRGVPTLGRFTRGGRKIHVHFGPFVLGCPSKKSLG